MATIVASASDRKASERKFYSRMALLLVFIVLLGFGPSFYLRGIVPSYPRPNPSLPPAVIFHGLVFTTWMLLIVAQTQLIAARKHALHMQVGKLGMLFAVLMMPVIRAGSVFTARSRKSRNSAEATSRSKSIRWPFPLMLITAPLVLKWESRNCA